MANGGKDALYRQSQTAIEAIGENETKTKQLRKRIGQLSTRRRADEVLELASSGADSLAIEGHEWDRNPYLLACPNGVIDLRTGELREGRQEEYIKTVCPTEYKGTDIGCPKKGTDAPCPAWEEFLFQIFDEDQELISYVKRLLGYSMLGLSTQHEFYIFWGQGRNGKGTLFQALSDVLGPYVSQAPKEMLLYNRFRPAASSPRSELMALRGKRLVWASESDEGRHLDTSQVKWLSGGDSLVAREVYGKHQVEFRPTFTLFLQTNHKPKANAYDYALWERIRLIPFNLSFVDDPQRDHERKRDPNLAEKLKVEGSGILSCLVQGCLDFQEHGLAPPDTVKMATESYRKDEDVIQQSFDECFYIDPEASVKAGEAYRTHVEWCDRNRIRAKSKNVFAEWMGERFVKVRKKEGLYYLGAGLREEMV